MTLRELLPIARGAWCRMTAPAVAICNTIPRFGKGETVTLADCDPYYLFHEPEEENTSGGRIPYNPELLAAIAAGQTRLTP